VPTAGWRDAKFEKFCDEDPAGGSDSGSVTVLVFIPLAQYLKQESYPRVPFIENYVIQCLVCFLCRAYGKGDEFYTASRASTADGKEGSRSGDLW
jgi:hypothetical protein